MAVQINVAANQAALTASIQAGVQAYNQRFAQNNQLNLTVNQRAFSQPLGRMTGDVKDFEAALAASNARVIAFGASTAVLGGVIRSFKELATVTIDVEKNLADINRVFGLTTSQLQKFSTDLFSVGKQTASTFDDASKAALEFSRQGLKAEDVLVRTKDALTLTRLAGIGTANAVDALTSTVNGFAATGVTTTQVLNKLVAVEQDYAVGAGDLAEALSRTGQAAQEAGVGLDQLNALVTAAQQSTARGGAVIGNALKTIFTRLQRNDTLDQLEAFNIAVRDVQGNILPAVTILQNFAGAYKNLGDAQRAQLSEQVAGVYQVNILKAIVGDLNKSQGVYAGALQRGASATNEAEVATAKLNQTLDALLKQTATSTQQLANNIGKVTFEPLAKYGTEQLKSFVENINQVLEGEGAGSTFANGLLKGIRNVIAGPGAIAAFFTLFKLIQNSFTYLAQALPQIAGITTETQNRKNIEQSILQIMQQQGPVSQALAGSMGNQAAQAQLLLQLARQQTAEYQIQSTLAKQLAAQLAGQGVRVKGSGGLQVTRAGGYIPTATRMAEVVGAQAGGYAPGKVVKSPVGGVMNTAEDVKYVPGFAQPFINPPAGSKAGRAHRENSISRTGVDPYMFNGFIPNFANTEYFNRKNDTLTLNATENKPFIIPDNNELSTVADPKKDSVYGLQYKIKFAGSYSKFSNAFDKKMLNAQQANKILLFSSLEEEQRKTFIENYKKYNSSKQDLQVKPFTANTKETINFSKQLQGVKSDTLGTLYELYLQKKFNLQENPNQTSISDLDFVDAEAKIGGFSSANLLSKAIRDNAVKKGIKKPYYKDNKKSDKIDLNNRLLTLYTTTASKGFIPNFATPMSTASIPWFKKYSSKYKNAAGDTDLFKMGDFPTYGRGSDHEYAKKGNANMLSYLHEDFVRSALNIALGSKQVIRPSEVGFRDKPISDIANENDFDLLYRIADGSYSMLELKQDFKNVSGSVTGFMNKKLANLEKENPVLAKKVSSMIAVSNRPKFTDPTGRNAGANFSEFEMAAASIVKDKYSNVDPSISAKLTKVTDGLLRRYEAKKNTTYGGFIPNFAYKQAVMGLEESMSGNKAIFDTKPFPHIRNSSQPTFSSAIADHGGLNNALSDSMRGQKAAGLMSKGYVPNFAKKANKKGKNQSQNTQSSFDFDQLQASAERVAQDVLIKINNAYQYIAVFGADFADIIENASKSTINKLGNATSKVQASVGNLSNNLTSSFSNISNSGNRFAKFSEKLSKASTAIAIAGPMLAGFAEQAIYGDKKRTDMTSGERIRQSALSTGLSSVSTGAGIGASFGLPGAIIGGAIGGLVGLTSALNAATLSAEELGQLNQEQVQKSQASISAASSYIEAQKSLTQMISSGASSSDVENASKKLSNNFNEIADVKLQEIFNATGGDVKKMTEELQKYTNQVAKKSALQKATIEKTDTKTTASALGFGLDKDQRTEVIQQLREAAKFKAVTENYSSEIIKAGNNRKISSSNDDLSKKMLSETQGLTSPNQLALSLLEKRGIDKTSPEFDSEYKAAVNKFNSMTIDQLREIADTLEKTDLVSGVGASINKLNSVATKSFNQIFLEIEQQIAKSAFDIALSFEKDSGARKIQSTILDFSMNFQDSINSFLSNNLPDARKFDFTDATAGQKAEMLLQKSQQDYDKAIAEQGNEKATFLNKSSKDLTASFKSSFLPSQKSAEFFQKNVFSQLEQGTFTGDARSLAGQMQNEAFNNAATKTKDAGFNLNELKDVDSVLKQVTDKMTEISTVAGTTGEEYKKLESVLESIQELNKQTALYTNDNEVKKLQGIIDESMREKVLFEQKQANAKKELEINKQLNEAKIAVDKEIAVAKARVDKDNLMRTEKMKDLSANIGNALEISKARSSANVNAMQRRLDDQRETYGMGRSQISERKFGIQADILKEQRAAEDAAINAEIQQRVLEMAAEQENTAATLELNKTITALIETQLRGALGGTGNIEKIFNTIQTAGPQEVDNVYGAGTYAQYQALQRIQESRAASAASNTGYNTSNFESNLSNAGFNNKMTQAEQLKFLEKEEAAARTAGNIVLAGTIKRYQDQIKTKKQALDITREDIDAQVKLATEIEKVNNTFAGRFKKGWGSLKQEGDDLLLNLGENLPKMFADGLVDGIKAAIRESNNLGEALMGIASKFLDSISSTLMQSAVYGILGNIGVPNLPVGGKQRGGVIRAQSGMYVSGVGSGDKYPAMLENGEYVLNRNAVMAMGGPASLDKLNFSHAPRFASGGSFSNKFDDISSMESNMTSYGLEESKLYNELRDQKRAEVEAARQKKKAQKQQMAGLIGSLAGAAVSLGISAGVNKFSQPGGYASTTAGKLESKTSLLGNQEAMTIVNGRAVMPSPYQVGGSIGSRLSDTIPAYATGGLINSPIVKRYAIGGVSSAGFGTAAGNNSTVNNNTSASNSFNFNTTVQRDGKIQVGANSTSYAQQDVELSQNLNSKVYDVVLETIRKEKRFGGSLAGIRN